MMGMEVSNIKIRTDDWEKGAAGGDSCHVSGKAVRKRKLSDDSVP